jgi:hypothetical protein
VEVSGQLHALAALSPAILSLEGWLSPTKIACPYVEPNPDTAAVQCASPSSDCTVTAAGSLACLHLSIVQLKPTGHNKQNYLQANQFTSLGSAVPSSGRIKNIKENR